VGDEREAVGGTPLVDAYLRLLRSARRGSLESAGGTESVDLSAGAIEDRVGEVDGELHRIVAEYIDDRPELHEIAGRIGRVGGDA
jgi:hypothetical protein